MIKVYTSKVGGGKSLTMLMDVALTGSSMREKDKKIAFISMEVTTNHLIRRLGKIANFFKIDRKNIKVTFFQGIPSSDYNLFERLDSLKNDYDLICIDGFDSYPVDGDTNISEAKAEFVRKVYAHLFFDGYLFKKPTRCKELWVTSNSYTHVGFFGNSLKPSAFNDEYSELRNKYVVKKHASRKFDGPANIENDPKVNLEVVDFEKRTIEIFDIGEILKD